MPEGLTIENLLKGEYISVVRNKKIADMFKEVGLIEKYGTGIRRILDAFRNYRLPDPRFDEFSGGFRVKVYKQASQLAITEVTGQVTGQVLRFCQEPRKAGEIQKLLGLRHRETFQNNYLKPLLDNGWLERTIPDKPRSRLQKYRLTEKGRMFLKKAGGE